MKTKPVILTLPFLEGLKITITFIYRDLSVCITPLELFFWGSSPWPSSFWVIPTPLAIPAPAKMPDVVVHDTKRNWLLLIEAVTSAGPVDRKRRKELKDLFAGCKAGLVFVTAFSTREVMRSFLTQLSWETEVWVAEDPEHLIHFNGERFLGPYPDVMPKVD